MMRASATSIFALFLLATASGCSSSSTAKGGDASSTNDAGQTSDVVQTNDLLQVNDVASNMSADAPVVPPDNVIFPEAPDVPCGGDAGDCQLPASACADPSCDAGSCPGLQWVVYYDNPTCVSGRCAYTNRYFVCSILATCSAGGCRYNGTAAP